MLGHLGRKFSHILFDALRKIRGETANPEVVGGHSRAGDLLVHIHDTFTLTEAIEKDRHCTDIQSVGRQPDKMALDPGQLRHEHAHNLGALRNFVSDAEQLFNRKDITQVVAHRRKIIQAVRQRQSLMISPAFCKLFNPAMEVADMRNRLDDLLAVQLQNQPQHPVSRRMLGPHVYSHGFGCRCHCTPRSFWCSRIGALNSASLIGFTVGPLHGIVLAQRMSLPIIGHKDSPRIGMIVKSDP